MCRNMFNKETLGKMKKGAWLVNTARGGIVNRDDIVEALESGHIAGTWHSACTLQPLAWLANIPTAGSIKHMEICQVLESGHVQRHVTGHLALQSICS